MARRECCVKSCGRSSHDFRGKKRQNGLTFHCFPTWRTNEGTGVSELTRRRRSAWVAAVAREDLSFSCIPSYMRVCSRHFHSGKPAYEKLDSDPDWVPSLHLGHDGGESTRAELLLESNWKKRKRLSTQRKPTEVSDAPPARLQAAEDCVVGRRNAAEPSWRELKSGLRSLLKAKSNLSQKTGEENRDGPAAETADVSFREFFRSALEASLEASIRARAQAKSQSSSQVNVPLDLEPLEGAPVTCEQSCSSSSSSSSSSISCLNCVRLERRIRELEGQLFALSLEQQYAANSEAPLRADEMLPDPEDEEHFQYELIEHHSPGEVVVYDEVQYEDEVDLGSESSSSTPTMSPTRSPTRCPTRCPTRSDSSSSSSPNENLFVPKARILRFKEEWLITFPFLRYSPSRNVMWCHVCRVHANEFQRRLALITGSRDFKKDSIVKHSNTLYHQKNLKHYSYEAALYSCEATASADYQLGEDDTKPPYPLELP